MENLVYDLTLVRCGEANETNLNKMARIACEKLLSGSGILALDVDGVLLKGKSGPDEFTDDKIAQILPILDKYLQLRLVTARSEGVVPIIRRLARHPLKLSGPHIIEEGHAWLMDKDVHPLVSQEYIHFFQSLRNDLKNNGLKESWSGVREVQNTFCWGDPRWQGRYSGSLWFRYQDRDFMEEKLLEKVQKLSGASSIPVDCHFNAQPNHDLSWMRIRSSNVNKAYRMHTLGLPDVYVCDGPNDKPVMSAMNPDVLLPYMHDTGGLFLALKCSPDEETEAMQAIYQKADYNFTNHQDFGDFLTRLANYLQK